MNGADLQHALPTEVASELGHAGILHEQARSISQEPGLVAKLHSLNPQATLSTAHQGSSGFVPTRSALLFITKLQASGKLVLMLKQFNLTVEDRHNKDDAKTKNGSERECIDHLDLLMSDLVLLLLNRPLKKENRHLAIAKPYKQAKHSSQKP